MRYCKTIIDNYIISVGTGNGGEEITQAEYEEIMATIQSHPVDTETVTYRLKTDLTWDAIHVDPPEPPEEVDDAEALEILLGGAT